MKRYLIIALLLFEFAILTAQTQFDIDAFADTTKYGWMNYQDRAAYRADLANRRDLLQYYNANLANSIQASVIKSAVIPGWGQFDNGFSTKGSVFLGAELLLAGASLYFYDRSLYYYDKYLHATQVEDIESYYNSAVSPRQYSMIFLGLGGLVWVYNIFDVIQSTEEHNSREWRKYLEEKAKSTTNPMSVGIVE